VTSAAATTLSERPATVTARWNSAAWWVLQSAAAMFPVNRAARMVPVTAMPIPVASSLEVSTSAAPIEVPARRLVAGEEPARVVGDQRERFERLFVALRDGVSPPA